MVITPWPMVGKLKWQMRHDGLVAVSSRGNWDGDETGQEWMMGFCIHQKDAETHELYHDDGRGNGSHIATYESYFDAMRQAEKEDDKLA